MKLGIIAHMIPKNIHIQFRRIIDIVADSPLFEITNLRA